MKKHFSSSVVVLTSFVLWGIVPLYYQFLPNANVTDLLSFRIIFCVPIIWLIKKRLNQKTFPWEEILKDKKSLLFTLLTGVLMCVSYYTFIWSLTHNDVLAASFGYFINPLFTIAFGVLFVKDKLTKMQVLSLIFALCAISIQVAFYGKIPWLSIIMGSFFAIYSLFKKFVSFEPLTAVALEAVLLSPFAIIYTVYSIYHGNFPAIHSGLTTFLLYLGTAPVTMLPLTLFVLGLQNCKLSSVGLMQYLEPSIQFLLAIFLFHEQFNWIKAISFSLIWIGLMLCIIEEKNGHSANL